MGLDENNPTTKLADKQMNCGSTPTHPRFLFYPITCTLSPGAHDQPGECCDAISLDTTGSARLIGSVRGEGFTNNAGIQTHTHACTNLLCYDMISCHAMRMCVCAYAHATPAQRHRREAVWRWRPVLWFHFRWLYACSGSRDTARRPGLANSPNIHSHQFTCQRGNKGMFLHSSRPRFPRAMIYPL